MTIADLLIELAPFYITPFIVLMIRSILKLVLTTARGSFEPIPDERSVSEEKEDINVDDDLQKYFNYKDGEK